MMRSRLVIAASLFLASGTAWADDADTGLVSAYFDAYNAHDIERMMSMVADDVRWMEAVGETPIRLIDGRVANADDFVVRTRDRAELEEALQGYFDSFPNARSIPRSMQVDGRFVTVFEEAVWDFAGVPMSQCATAVYEIGDGVIVKVWYSSEQPCED